MAVLSNFVTPRLSASFPRSLTAFSCLFSYFLCCSVMLPRSQQRSAAAIPESRTALTGALASGARVLSCCTRSSSLHFCLPFLFGFGMCGVRRKSERDEDASESRVDRRERGASHSDPSGEWALRSDQLAGQLRALLPLLACSSPLLSLPSPALLLVQRRSLIAQEEWPTAQRVGDNDGK